MADGAVDICGPLMGSCTASIVGVDAEYRLRMTAFALGLRAIVQLQAGMVTGPGVTDDTGFRAGGVDGLGIRMTQSAGIPVQWHVGDIRNGIHVIGRIAFLDMTHGALHIGLSPMTACAASIIGLNGKYRLGMAAFTLGLGTVIKIQTGMGPVS